MKSFYVFLIGLTFLNFFFISCNKDEVGQEVIPEPKPVSKRPYFTKFWMSKDVHTSLTTDYVAEIEGESRIKIFCPELSSTDSVMPSFEGNYTSVKVEGVEQTSGESVHNFNRIIRYELRDSIGNIAYYDVIIKALNGIPRIDIVTEDSVDISSKKEYVNASFYFSNCPETGVIDATGKIRGRGNATWFYPKKPYRIKFDVEQRPFRFASNRDWVLLAESCDRTLLRTTYMSEVSKAVGFDFSIRYQHVDLYLNDDYMGTYIFTDVVEKGRYRVNIADSGFLFELDPYAYLEPLFFVTDKLTFSFSFKYPNADDGSIVEGDANYSFITSYMNRMEQALLTLLDNPMSLEYQSYIDVNSFAKWYITAELTATYDPNMFYVLASPVDKIKLFPIWDAEWSLGLWPVNVWKNMPDPMVTKVIWKRKFYFKYLFKSKSFVEAVKEEWYRTKDKLSGVKEAVKEVANSIALTQKANFERWPGSGGQELNVQFDTWEEEVEYINDFFDKRIKWMDSYINSL